jgi:pimeloyl-ACP methyl ester carboxylesterase
MCSSMESAEIGHNGGGSLDAWQSARVFLPSTWPGTARPVISSVPTGSAATPPTLRRSPRRVFDGAILIGHSMGAAVCLEAARILGDSVNHVVGLDARLFPELFGQHNARKSAAAPCPPGSAVRGSLPQQRRLHRTPLGVHPPRPLRHRAQDDVRPNTAASPACCTLISPAKRFR